MMSFYEKLSMKLQGEGAAPASKNTPAPAGPGVSYNATGVKTAAPAAVQNAPAAQAPATENTPDGMDPLMVDLFQSETRMVVIAQAAGVLAGDFDVTADEESNTLLIQATQKRPGIPPPPGAPANAEPEKGRFSKQETKWNTLYRKVYLPEPFDSGMATTSLEHGVLVVVLPIKKLGEGKKLPVREPTGGEPKK